MTKTILPETSLCAIVCDEIMNPAGGIVDFVDSTLPYVEAGVIVDTGSKDGTREALEELKTKYPHLEVYDREFRGFADARNESLKHCKTKRALVLDADERLTREDFQELQEVLTPRVRTCSFFIRNIRPDEIGECKPCGLWNPRLFMPKVGFIHFEGRVGEQLHVCYTCCKNLLDIHSHIAIKHFKSQRDFYSRKINEFYSQLSANPLDFSNSQIKPLRDFPFFQDLRKYNPKREEYR